MAVLFRHPLTHWRGVRKQCPGFKTKVSIGRRRRKRKRNWREKEEEVNTVSSTNYIPRLMPALFLN